MILLLELNDIGFLRLQTSVLKSRVAILTDGTYSPQRAGKASVVLVETWFSLARPCRSLPTPFRRHVDDRCEAAPCRPLACRRWRFSLAVSCPRATYFFCGGVVRPVVSPPL
jgi:hypothetical protein